MRTNSKINFSLTIQAFRIELFVLVGMFISSIILDYYVSISFILTKITIFYGIFLISYMIHEYFHIFGLRKKGVKYFYIEKTISRFSIYYNNNSLSKKNIIYISVIGPFSCFLIGIVLFLLSNLFTNYFLKYASYIFIFHIIFLLPIFGDGKVILETLRGGDRNDYKK